MSDIKRVAFSTLSSGSGSGTGAGTGTGTGTGTGSGTGTGAGAGASSGNGVIPSSTTAAAFHRFGAPPDPLTSHKSSPLSSSSGIGNGNGAGNAGTGGTGGGGGSGVAKATKTIRLNMELFASNSDSFPEFNYSKLIHLEKKKLKKLKSKQNGFSDPFEENDDDVARIAKELEKKYGTAYASGRGRSKKDDFCDIGLGYDENDSFIDNTEAYDEIIPEEVETVEGGFYINSGALVFKHLSSTEKTDEIIKMPTKARKRALSTSSEESGSSEEEVAEKEPESSATAPPAATTTTVNNPSQGANPKVSTNSNSSSSSNKQKNSVPTEKRHKTNSDKECSDKEKSSKSKGSTTTSAASSVTVSASASPKNDDAVSEGGSKDKARGERTVKTTTVKDMLKAKRDNFLKMQEEELKTKTSNGETKASTSAEDASGSDSSSEESDINEEPSAKKSKKTSEEESDKLRQSDSKLPDLSDELFRDIQDMKDTAKTSNRTGKKFQFDEKLTEVFLRIDDMCLCLDKNSRNVVFAHLEYQLALPKYFLLRKAKQLRINQEKTKTKKAFVKLRKAVEDMLPNIVQQYQMNLRTYEEFQLHNAGADIHKLENVPKMPKKRFAWNDATRTLLYDLYQIRWMSYTVLRTRKESFEDFVGNFLKDKVVNIWPSGWMKYEELKREIEKKKNVPKKLKENKKPDESHDALHPADKIHLSNQETAINSLSKLPLNVTDIYAMSSSSELIGANLKQNDMAKLLPAHSNASSEHMQSSKTYSSSGKVHRTSTSSPLNLCSGQSQSSMKGEKSSSGCVTNNNNNTNPNQNLNSNRSSGNVNISKNVVDLVSPSKRTDHSINSIMSSPSSTSSSVSTTPQPQHSAGMGNTLTVDNNTHVINIDNFKSASEIINTSNQLINHSNKNQSNDRLKGRSSAADIHQHTTHSQFKLEIGRRDSSSESDGVEIVGVYQARSTTSALPPVNKNKYKKSSHQDIRGDSPSLNEKIKTAPATAASKKSIDSSDLDVNKIMMALKELEELQQTGNFAPDISSLTGNNANTSPLAYGKDLTQ